MNQTKPDVALFPTSPMMLEVHSERLFSALRALMNEGFKVSNVPGHTNRFRVTDAKEQTK